MANAYVLPLEQLRMTDVASVGGKNASLGELISQLSAAGVRVPGGFATTAQAFTDFLARRRPEGADRRGARRPRRRATWARSRGPAPRSAQWVAAAPFQPELERQIREAYARGRRRGRGELRGALLGHGRGPARRLLRRPAGDLPQHPRHRQRARRGEAGVRLALQRPRHRLPRAQGLRARRRRALRGRAAHGALRHRRGRRDVHARHRVRLPRRGLHHLELRPGRDGGAGRGEPGRVLRLQAVPRGGPARDPAPRPGRQGHQDGLHRRGQGAQVGRAARRRARRPRPLLAHRRRRRASSRATPWRSRSTTAARWTSSGARTAATARSTSCRPAPRR